MTQQHSMLPPVAHAVPLLGRPLLASRRLASTKQTLRRTFTLFLSVRWQQTVHMSGRRSHSHAAGLCLKLFVGFWLAWHSFIMSVSLYSVLSSAASSLPQTLCLRSSLEIKLISHQALAIVFQLEYVFSTPIGRETTVNWTHTNTRPAVPSSSPLCSRTLSVSCHFFPEAITEAMLGHRCFVNRRGWRSPYIGHCSSGKDVRLTVWPRLPTAVNITLCLAHWSSQYQTLHHRFGAIWQTAADILAPDDTPAVQFKSTSPSVFSPFSLFVNNLIYRQEIKWQLAL